MSHATVCQPWRHYVSEAPDLTAEGTKNSFIDIELRDYQIQGAHPVDDAVIGSKLFQGGYLLNFRVKVPPLHGKVTVSPSGRGFRYHPTYGYVGNDEFFYVLNNGTQNSNIGRIGLTIADGLDGQVIVSRLRPTTDTKNIVLKFSGSYSIPEGWPVTYDFVQLSLIETRPIIGYMNMLPYVFDTPYIYYSSRWTESGDWTPIAAENTVNSPWKIYPLPFMIDGYYPYTQEPYPKPIYTPWPMVMRVDFYKTPILVPVEVYDGNGWHVEDRFARWGLHHSITIDLETSLGKDWYENGTVQWIKYGQSGWPTDLFPDGL